MGENTEQAKDLLRRRIRVARGALSAETVAASSAAAAARILALPVFAAVGDVVAYVATDNEIDLDTVAAALRASGRRVYYPRLAREGLEFAQGHPGSFRPGHRGIPEPTGGELLPAGAEAVVFLVPGVAFDVRGGRLGRGRGHYDRALTRHAAATRIGVAHDFQVVPHLPEDPWDVRMHAIVTEARVLACAEGRIGQ
jgi:5-formyltetrahydrofolate cyclo-ligase